MVLVEGEKAEGVTVDRDAFELSASDGGAISSPSDQVIDAVLGTREGAVAAGHHLVSTGVAWKDRAEAAALQQALSERGIDDVTLFSEAQAAGALAQAIGKAVGYDTTALMVVEPDTATLSVVQTADGSIVKLVSRSLAGADAMAAVTDMVAGLETQEPRPDGMFVVGSGADALSVKSNLERLLSLPVRAPDEPELALARAAALAAANASRIDATTVGLAYSRERDQDSTGVDHFDAVMQGPDEVAQNRKPFLLAGSALTTIFAVGVVGLVVSLAVNIQTAADQRAAPGESVFHPKALAAAPPKIENVQPVDPRPVPQSIPIPDPADGSPQTP
ncbi:MAG: hypothetical protein ACM4D3_22485 [Candidatus Sericytochromatia bacterium]